MSDISAISRVSADSCAMQQAQQQQKMMSQRKVFVLFMDSYKPIN
jgi:hypothetical protein